MKLLTHSASSMAEVCFSKDIVSPKLEGVEEKQELPDLVAPDDELKKVKRVNLGKRPCTSNEDGDGGEEVDPAYDKCKTPEATEVVRQGRGGEF